MADPGGPLQGLAVLVTRPAPQAAGLVSRIERVGGETVRFPAIEIQPVDAASLRRRLPKALEFADLAIFISVNAANAVCTRLAEVDADIPDSCLVAAVGRATARRLEEAGIAVDLVPEGPQSSEGLLDLPEMQLLEDASVVILRGEGGRPLLGDTLRVRGATVTYVDCYRRGLPAAVPGPLLQRWRRGGIDIVTATSVQTVDNLMILLEEERSLLLDTPIVVVSERVAEHCSAQGWRGRIVVAADAGDEAIVKAIADWRRSGEG